MKPYSPDFLEFLKVISTEKYYIADTETTALVNGEVVQIAITDEYGSQILNRYVKPKNPIPADATAIHGITNEMVKDMDSWPEVRYDVISAISDKTLIVYNAKYDRSILHSSDDAWGISRVEYKVLSRWYCAMLAYAEFYGEWNDYRKSFKWQRLTDAAAQMHLVVQDAHNALGDCQMTAGLLKVMRFQAHVSSRHPDNIDVETDDSSTPTPS